ncbi:MAG: hypothetical protein K2K92_03340 [Duncaniella sp.]|nr:hypothetical protein [Duncaniella sp.]
MKLSVRQIANACASLLIIISAEGCSCSHDRNYVSTHVRDKKAYSLGEEHAQRIIGIRDNESAVQDALLDVRARMTNIDAHLGAQAAADYERGFTDYIKQHDDSLAHVLF